MATTTPNFGWPVPTSTDLVKDGAVAIEGLGDAIDASLLDLKGGTTGQVLKKNTNADMDFVWSADSAGMTNPMTTTGDTIYSSSGSTPARLGIGTTGQVLTVAGGIPSWATPAGGSPTFTGCMLYKGADQTISNGTVTAITFAATDYIDTDGFHDPATNNSRITIPTGKGGKYAINAMAWIAAQAQGNYRVIIRLNGSSILTTRGSIGNSNTNNGTASFDSIYTLAAGDYIEFFLMVTSGFSSDVYGDSYEESSKSTLFSVQFLGA